MRNDTSSTDAYDTGVVQLSEPFYPMNYNGVQNRLEITVPSYNDDPSNLMRNEITDGYKWTLSVWEQYDSENPDESMVTSVEQFFWTKSASNIQIVGSTAPATITSRENLWKATYTSTSSVQWFQWTLAEVVDGNHNTVYQTGRIYGSSQIWFEYSGLVSGRTYAVQVQVVNQYGQSVISPWVSSLVQYDTVTVSGATDINQIEEGVRADWSGVQYIEGEALYKTDDSPSTNYEILDDYPVADQHSLDVESDTYVRFESSPTFTMEASEDGTFVWAGRPDRYDPASGVTLLEFTDVEDNPIRTLRHEGFVPGLEPDSALVPSGSENQLFDKDNPDFLKAYINISTDKIRTSSSNRSVYVKCRPNTKYTASKIAIDTADGLMIGWTKELPAVDVDVFDHNGKTSSFTIGNRYSYSTTTGPDAKYIVVWCHRTSSGDMADSFNTLQINAGDTIPYEAYVTPLEPDDGTGGGYVYTSPNGTYTQDTQHAPYHWYVVEMPPDGIVVHEFNDPDGEA